MKDPVQSTLPPAAYVNFLRVGQGPSEFLLSFGQLLHEDATSAQLLASLVTSPVHAKSMARALAEAVERYETLHGPIPVPEPPAQAPAQPGRRAPRREREAKVVEPEERSSKKK